MTVPGPFNTGAKQKPGRPSLQPNPADEVSRRCGKCFGVIHKGITHNCLKTNRQEVLNDSLSPKSKESFASSVVRQKIQDTGDTNISLQPQTGGAPVRITAGSINSSPGTPLVIGHSTFEKLKVHFDTSNKKIEQAAQILKEAGAKPKAYLRKFLNFKSNEVKDFFEVKEMECVVSEDPPKKGKGPKNQTFEVRPVVVCKDLKGLIEYILEKRGWKPEDVELQVGLDGGGGFFKVGLTIRRVRGATSPQKKKSFNRKYRDGGVKKLIILAIAPKTGEYYLNVKKILDEIGIAKVNFCVSSDLKLINIMFGIQNHASTYPCCWCYVQKDKLIECGQMRTIGGIWHWSNRFQADGMVWKDAKDYFNCIYPPIFEFDDDDLDKEAGELMMNQLVLDKLPPPELHLFTGTTNSILKEANKVSLSLNKEDVFKFIYEQYKIRQESYHGGMLAGPQCYQLKFKLDDMATKLPHLEKHINLLKLFFDVCHACFGMQLDPSYEMKIEAFKDAVIEMKFKVTPKIHVLICHVPQHIKKTGRSLGHFSEQAFESLHHDFKSTWARYCVLDITKPSYGQKLLAATVEYNSFHIFGKEDD